MTNNAPGLGREQDELAAQIVAIGERLERGEISEAEANAQSDRIFSQINRSIEAATRQLAADQRRDALDGLRRVVLRAALLLIGLVVLWFVFRRK